MVRTFAVTRSAGAVKSRLLSGTFQPSAIVADTHAVVVAGDDRIAKILRQLDVQLKVFHRGRRAVARNDRVDVLDRRGGFRQRVRICEAAAAILEIDGRQLLVAHQIAHVHDAQRGEDDPGIASGVARSEVEEIDPILAAAKRHLLPEHEFREEVHLDALERRHPVHVQACVVLRDDLDRGGEELIAPGLIAMGMGVDDGRHRLRGDSPNLVENRLAPSCELRVDENDPELRDQEQ